MGKEAIFYIGRIVKIGFTQEDFISTLFDSKPFDDRNNIWNISNMSKEETNGIVYYFGKLGKANPDAKVTIMSQGYKQQIEKEEPDLVIASSEFVYVPDYSGIAFHSIPGKIEPKKFKKVFSEIIERSFQNFFVECQINLIDDLESFYRKLNKFESISRIMATVNPPNPLFGKFWEDLKNYLAERNASELRMQEQSKDSTLKTDVKELIQLILEGNNDKIEKYLKEHKLSHMDLMVLMALDGYGKGRIDGNTKSGCTFIKTHESLLHFSLPKDQILVTEVFTKTNEVLKGISDERYMEHKTI
jgi:hypothetical protein